MIFNRSNVFLFALGLLAVLSPHPTAAASRKAGGRRTRSEDAAERRRLLEEREEAFAAANPYSVVDQEHRRAGSGSGTGSGHYGFYYPYSGSGTGSGTGKGKGSSKCGLPGERCCADPSHRCVPGYGCKFPDDFTEPAEEDYICVECGKAGDPCCNIGCGEDSCESSCLPGNTCNLFKNTCEECGGDGQPCCPGDVCSAGSTCDPINKICNTCGVQAGDPCCSDDSGDFCSGDSLACDKGTATCENCGGDGQICCPGDVCTLDTQACNTGTGRCENCGDQPGAICCSGAICPYEDGTNPVFPLDAPGLSCNPSNNRCQPCGEGGQTCCPSGVYECPCDGCVADCVDGSCVDLGTDPAPGCTLGNGKGPALEYYPNGQGCNQSNVQTANNDLCCKGTCEQDPGTTGDGVLMWCKA